MYFKSKNSKCKWFLLGANNVLVVLKLYHLTNYVLKKTDTVEFGFNNQYRPISKLYVYLSEL